MNISNILSFLKTVSDENRLKILCFLKDGEQCVCDIVDFTHIPQNLVSHHLKRIKDIWLVSSKKEWLKVLYYLNNSEIQTYLEQLHYLFNK